MSDQLMFEEIIAKEDLSNEDVSKKRKISENRLELVNLSREAFEVGFPKKINDDYINNYLRQIIKNGSNEMHISIGWNHAAYFHIEKAVLRYFFKYSLFGYNFGRIKYKQMKIKKLIRWAKYEAAFQPLPREISENSQVVKKLISKLQDLGYQAELHHDDERRSSTVLVKLGGLAVG